MRQIVPVVALCLLLVFALSGCGFIVSKLPRVKLEPPAGSQQAQETTATETKTEAAGAKPAEDTGESQAGEATTGEAGEGTAAEAGEAGETQEIVVEPPEPEPTTVLGDLPKVRTTTQPAATRRVRYVPVGSRRTLTTADLQGLSRWQLDVLRNEIYAAHGRPFARADLRNYFARQTWYVADPGFSEARLSALEKRNAAFIADYQQRRGQTGGGTTTTRRTTGSSGFILPFSSSRTVTASDLRGLSRWQLDIARNEIYARHGRPFKRSDLRNYFRGKSWYREDSGFSEGRLSSLEKRNAEFIRQYQGG